jgi:membrane dipeptidase
MPHLLCALLFLSCAGARPVTSRSERAPLEFGADLHVHVTMRQANPFVIGEPGDIPATRAVSPDQSLVNQLQPEDLHRAGVKLLVATLWPPFRLRPGRTELHEAINQAEELRRFAQRHPDFAIVLDARAARTAVERGQIALLPGVEGAEAIQRVEDVDALYAAGIRVVGLVHFTDNAIADAQDNQFGTLLGGLFNGEDHGLTPLGRAALERMIDLGMVIDVAHASDRTVADALELTAGRVPIISSHAGPGFEGPTLSDPLARRLLEQGGLIGIGVYRHDLLVPSLPQDQLAQHQRDTCDDVIAHWNHYARLGHPDSVMLGSDFNSLISRGRPGGHCPHGIRSTRDLPYLLHGVEQQGWPVERSGDRLLRLLDEVAAKAVPAKQAQAAKASLDRGAPFDSAL